jgi:hypothetical protein
MSNIPTRSGRPFRSRPAALVLAALIPALTTAAAAADQDSKSAAAAKELADALDKAKLDSIAAADPNDKETFVAALYFPGAQLLVVSAKYSAPSLLVSKIAKKEYRDTYIDLNSASIAGSKVFIMDHAANGMIFKPNGDDLGADSWEQNNKTVSFDGKWRDAKLSEDEYTKKFSDADARYAAILALLTAQAKKDGTGS